jgi:uncharacterized protein YciI
MAICNDGGDKQALRQATLQAHLDYAETIAAKIAVAGPLAEADSSQYRVSVFVYDVDDINEAEALLHNDPYYIAGLYDSVKFQEFKPAIGHWVGGRQWP